MLLSLGKNDDESLVNEMLAEAPGPINFTMFLTLFGQFMSATDPLDTLIQAFSCFDEDGSGNTLNMAGVSWAIWSFKSAVFDVILASYRP